MPAPTLTDAEVRAFLADLHGTAIAGVVSLPGGYWSSAFAYEAGGKELVVRFSDMREGFDIDRAAHRYDSCELPVPVVLDVGEAFGAFYAISDRRHGRFLESVAVHEADAAAPAVLQMLGALRTTPLAADESTSSTGSSGSWREWLLGGFVDDPAQRVSGWRATLAADPTLDLLFRRCEDRVNEILPAVPERRDLVHGDLLNRNVLIAGDLSRVTAVFSWKCSTRGDFLFDVAWCTFWGGWHPGIASMNLFERTVADAALSPDDLTDAALRHHCYELQIGGGHLGWHAWTGDASELHAVATRVESIVDRGPLST